MNDRETVIKALEYCAVGTKDCFGCPMKDECKGVSNGAMAEAARLLKEQDPVEPRKILPCITRPVGGYVCGHCGIRFLEKNDYYCPNCGRAVKWDG